MQRLLEVGYLFFMPQPPPPVIFGGEINVEGWRLKYLLELKRFFKTKAINFIKQTISVNSF